MKRLIKLLILFLILNTANIGLTNSYFSARASVEGSHVSAGCWVAPSVPVLTYPSDGTRAGLGSAWDLNPYMDWENSVSDCPLANIITYQYESYHDAGLVQLAYRSGWLTDSRIPAPGTPDGTYYWRVRSRDSFGNESSFTGPWQLKVDRVAPIISNVSHFIGTPGSPNQKKATVSWDTNEPATSNLKWRRDLTDPWTALIVDSTPWTALTVDSAADRTHHSRDIDGLLPETTYYYVDYYVEVESADSAGNLATASYSFVTGILITGVDWYDDIVINEFLPNPIGNDAALMPNGEWVELYNRGSGSSAPDLQGWYLTDFDSSHRLYLTTTNTTSSNPATSGLNIAPGEFMVVYRNGDPNFDLENSFWGDEVSLYSSTEVLPVDQHSYSVAFGDEVLENKSIARYPDGTDNWFDPIPSPGRPNVLEVQPWPTPTPSLEFSLRSDKKAVSFNVSEISGYNKLSYEIIYDSNNGEKGIAGSVDLSGETAFSRNDLLLGSCSEIEGNVCVCDEGITKLHLKVTLVSGGVETVLEKEIDY